MLEKRLFQMHEQRAHHRQTPDLQSLEVTTARLLLICLGFVMLASARGRLEQMPATPLHPQLLHLTSAGPNRSDEAVAASVSMRKARQFLDEAALAWTRGLRCGTCHTNYAYMIGRPSLGAGTPASEQVRRFFENYAASFDTDQERVEWPTQVVATAVTLSLNDAATTGRLHAMTREALEWMWTLQRDDGSWNWIKTERPPLEADDYYGAVFAAVGAGHAPDGYAGSPAAKPGLERLRAYLARNAPPNLHHETMLLWASTRLPDLMPGEGQAATIAKLLAVQRADGGWSLPSLGNWIRRDGTPNDRQRAPSDGYGTGFVVYVLRQTGMPATHPAIARAVEWLKANQRESGRWFTRSLSQDTYHFISHAGTAYAVMALKACGVNEGD
jgi:squalene-hopene/tetraprenyl-beta-curcumene cyclase